MWFKLKIDNNNKYKTKVELMILCNKVFVYSYLLAVDKNVAGAKKMQNDKCFIL